MEKYNPGSVVIHASFGEGMVVEDGLKSIKVYFHSIDKTKNFDKEDSELELAEGQSSGGLRMSIEEVEDVLWRVLTRYGGLSEEIKLGDRWTGGTLLMQPGDSSLQSKEIPIEAFFHKIVMVRDRLRVLEQQINASKKLEDEDKVHMQQYITRIYGSLTSFNQLFKHKSDHFKGLGKS